MATSWFSDPELMSTTFSVSYVANNLSKADDVLVRRASSVRIYDKIGSDP
jgi:hypothetical protein